MYDVICKLKNDTIEYFNMGKREVNEIIEDLLNTYVFEIVNVDTKKRYIIINKQSVKDFYTSEKFKKGDV